MSPFELSSEHETFRKSVREFALGEIAPHAARWDKEHHFPTDVVRQMGDLGLMGLTAPEEFGGMGEDGDFTSLCVAIEEIGRVDQSMGITLEAAVGLGINPIQTFGTDEQRQQWLPDLVAGRAIAGFGLTEPGAGSDAGATRTRAELVDGEWVVNGAKQFITNSGSDITSVVTVTARTGTRRARRPEKAEVSTIILPSGTPGFTAEAPYDKLGWHASDTHALTFEDARVPEGQPARASGGAASRSSWPPSTTAGSPSRRSRSAASRPASTCRVEYAGTRTTFGVPIGAKQGVAFQVADLEVMLEASRMLTYRAAAMKDAGRPMKEFKQAAAIAKLYATESAVTATRIATQVFGGYGFMEEYPVARFYRDAKVLEIGEGTSEVQRMLIARGRGLPVE